jgi:crotonobetainyl-CoA:carnitine CoA-transferase CaiB-like acyl-CoA transferase
MADETGQAALSGLWQLAGGSAAALDHVELSGDEALPSSFRIGAVAQAAIAAAGLAAAAHWQAKTGRWQRVAVDARHAALEFRSERYLQIDGAGLASIWDPIAGLYRAGDGRPVRLHTKFAHHRQVVLDLLDCAPTREAVQRALERWTGFAFEAAAIERGGVVAALRSHEEWADQEQARALATLPVLTIERIGDAPPRPLAPGARPLSGLRVLDLTRIIAGPVAGRTLAAHGADVMLISAPGLPFVDWLAKDTGRGKLSAHADLKTEAGRAQLDRLVDEADVFIDGFRPGATAARGFGPAEVAARRPGIVYVSLSAYSHLGPWAGRRGFDSLVQTASGFNHAEGAAAGTGAPKELPCQALDHAAGYLLAFGAMMARLRQAEEGGSWLVRASLAQTGRWIWQQGRLENGFAVPEPSAEEVAALTETSPSPFGAVRAIRHAARLAETPASWVRPTVPLGSDAPVWP